MHENCNVPLTLLKSHTFDLDLRCMIIRYFAMADFFPNKFVYIVALVE